MSVKGNENGGIAFAEPPQNISFLCGPNNSEMLRITPQGFYVRGNHVPESATEGKEIYDAFLAWLHANGIR